jgi:hypothetical protein
MIFGDLKGGLGNQLFQIFAVIAYCIREQQPFCFPVTFNPLSKDRPSYWSSLLQNLSAFLTTAPPPSAATIREASFQYSALPSCKPGENYLVHGYFQSYLYFRPYYGTIYKLLGIEKAKAAVRDDFPFNYDHTVSLHFRLGDYKWLSHNHNILPPSYYMNALRYINTPTVLFFCEADDLDAVESVVDQLRRAFPDKTFVRAPDDVPDWKQMLMMSLCAHNIIANSSFSWWGAYFNSNPEKCVCYPQTWFGPQLQTYDTSDMCPPAWTRVDF